MSGTRAVSAVAPDEGVLRVPEHGGVLVFDGFCGFCTRSVRTVLRWDRRGRVRALPLQGPGVLELTGLTRTEALARARWVGADGRRASGAHAMAAAAGAATGMPLAAVCRTPGVRILAERAYRWIAEHRRLLPGAVPHCAAVPGARCDTDRPAAGWVRPARGASARPPAARSPPAPREPPVGARTARRRAN